MSQSTTSSTSSASNTASQTYGPHPLPWPRYQPPTRPPPSTATSTQGISSSLFRSRSQSHSAPRWNPISTFRNRLSGSVSGPSPTSHQPLQSSSLPRSSSSSNRRYSSATLPAQQIFPEASSLTDASTFDHIYTTPPSSKTLGPQSTSPTSTTIQDESPPASPWAVDPGNSTSATSGCILIPTDDNQPRTMPDFSDISLPTPLSLADFSLFNGGAVTEGEDVPIISPGLTSPTSQFGFGFNANEYNAPDGDGEWMNVGMDSGVEMMDEFAGVETIPREPVDYEADPGLRRGVNLGLATDISVENVFGVQRPEPLRLLANGVYYPNWHIYKGRAPSSLPLGMISHIFYAFAHVKEDGTVFLSDEWADLQMDVDGTKGCLNAMKALKGSHPHLKTIISIGGGAASQNFASVAADANKRANFARTAHAMLVQHGLDGLDIDWEHPSNPTEGHHYLLLLQTIRQFLPEHTYILTSALPATKWHLQHIPLAQCAQYLNFLNLMTYDFFGPWSERTGHHSQLYPHPSEPDAPSCNTAIEYLTRPPHNIPPHKILLGVPTYGRSFIGAHAPGMKFTGHAGEEGTFECQDLPRPGSNVIRDRERGTISCVGGDAGYVGYEDGETVRGKGVWSRKRGLGGMFYWTGHGGNGLVEEGFRGLHGG